MALNTAGLTADLTAYFSDLTGKTAAVKAAELALIIETYVKTATIKTGTLASTGTGNMGLPVNSTNTNTGTIE